MRSRELDLDTSSERLVDLTDEIRSFCSTLGDGLCNVFAPHATVGLVIIETGAGSEGDLEDLAERLLPRDDRYRHCHGSSGHGADHLVPSLFPPSITLPVVEGHPQLGTWQHVVLLDLNPDNLQRRVRFSFVSG